VPPTSVAARRQHPRGTGRTYRRKADSTPCTWDMDVVGRCSVLLLLRSTRTLDGVQSTRVKGLQSTCLFQVDGPTTRGKISIKQHNLQVRAQRADDTLTGAPLGEGGCLKFLVAVGCAPVWDNWEQGSPCCTDQYHGHECISVCLSHGVIRSDRTTDIGPYRGQ
jgi:hypothetical protein